MKKDPRVREFILALTSRQYADRKKTEDRIEKMLEELRLERIENQKTIEKCLRRYGF